MSENVVICGYGIAAVNAAIALRHNGFAGTIQVLSDHAGAPYSPIITSYYAGGTKTQEECFPWSATQIAGLKLDVVKNCTVTGIDTAARTVATSKGEFPYAACLIATGAAPVLNGWQPVEGYEPLVLRTMADAERLAAACKPGARILISGTSMVALKAAEACLDRGVAVTLLGRSEHILKRVAVPQVAQRFEEGLAAMGVELKLGCTIASAAMAGAKVNVAFSDGANADYDAVLVAHGMTPNIEFARSAVACDRGILVDEFMRTSAPGVYAAGDVAQVRDLTSGETVVAEIWKAATHEGCAAGVAMAAELAGAEPDAARAYPGVLLNNDLRVHETVLLSGGHMDVPEGFELDVYEDGDCLVALVRRGEEIRGYNVVTTTGRPGGRVFDLGAAYLRRM